MYNNQILEHRLCVKLIRHFYYNNDYTDSKKLKDLSDKGPINEENFKLLKKIIPIYENQEFFSEKGYSLIPLFECQSFYLLFFKYVMDITEDDKFKFKKFIRNKNDLYEIFLPNFKSYPTNSFKYSWEQMKRTTDEYELSAIFEFPYISKIFLNKTKERRKNVKNIYENSIKKIRITEKNIEETMSVFGNLDIS